MERHRAISYLITFRARLPFGQHDDLSDACDVAIADMQHCQTCPRRAQERPEESVPDAYIRSEAP